MHSRALAKQSGPAFRSASCSNRDLSLSPPWRAAVCVGCLPQPKRTWQRTGNPASCTPAFPTPTMDTMIAGASMCAGTRRAQRPEHPQRSARSERHRPPWDNLRQLVLHLPRLDLRLRTDGFQSCWRPRHRPYQAGAVALDCMTASDGCPTRIPNNARSGGSPERQCGPRRASARK
jgi:hypothetical protein